MKNKLFLLSAALMTALLLLAGCGSSEKTASKTDDGRIEVEFWYGLGGKLGENVEKFIKDFNESQDEIKVVGVAQGDYDETVEKLQAAMAAKKVPSAVLLENDPMHSFADKGLLASMNTFIEKDNEFKSEDFIDVFYKQGTIDGEQYALPMYGTTQVLYYRKDMFEEAGVSPEELNTWESLKKATEKLTKRNGEEVTVYGWEPMWDHSNLIDATLSRGGKFLSEDGKEVMIDSPEWIETWDFFRKAIHEDKTMRIHHGGQGWEYWYKTIDDVMQGRAAGYTGSSGDQGDLDFTKVAAHIQPGWEGNPAAPVAGALVGVIPKAAPSEEQEAAFKWLNYFSSAEKSAEWSMNSGYIAVRKSAQEVPAYKEFAEKNPQILVPLKQAQQASPLFVDPTGGKIYDALKKAADKVEIENISAEKALKAAKEEAQRELDKAGN
ncbi:ABC transporter substrate-binding protein [Bacillus sp. MKU004]|nr:ABC transporter substrate-binding protein [Bacillus sp. MKU004]